MSGAPKYVAGLHAADGVGVGLGVVRTTTNDCSGVVDDECPSVLGRSRTCLHRARKWGIAGVVGAITRV
jgi:hypothetical protein